MEQNKALALLNDTKDSLQETLDKLKFINEHLTNDMCDDAVSRIQLEQMASIEFDYMTLAVLYINSLNMVAALLKGGKTNGQTDNI